MENQNAGARCLLPAAMPERWQHFSHIQITFGLLQTTWFVSTRTNSMKCPVKRISLRIHVCSRNIQPYLEKYPTLPWSRVRYLLNERGSFSVEFSLQGISSNSLVWKRTNSSVVMQTWSWRGKHAASTRAGLRAANAGRLHFIFTYELLYFHDVKMWWRVRSRVVHNFGTCKDNAAGHWRTPTILPAKHAF